MDHEQCTDVVTNGSHHSAEPTGSVMAMIEKHEAALVTLLGFSLFSVLLALLYNAIRRYVFHDADNVDTAFDAGGNVSTTLTAVTIASQLLWPGDVLQSATVAVKYGVSGAFWYSTAAAINITLFPLLSLHFKTRAPGAKTYLQVIQARFGKVTHTVFCVYALLINVVILTALAVVGVALIQGIVTEASPEFCMLVLATLCGSYSFIGGLGSTFYVCYFNAVVVFILLGVLVVNIFYTDHPDHPLLGKMDVIYRKIACLPGPETNEDDSFLTFWSEGGVIWACTGICLTASITFCDQASWQSRVAAKPVQGVLGFLLATFVWFAVPSAIGTTTGLSYLALAAHNSSMALPPGDIDAGLVTVYVSQLVLGRAGSFLILIMFTMLVMSTGSSEIMAVASIIVYDIYQIYINPFRRNLTGHMCVLCGKTTVTQSRRRRRSRRYSVSDEIGDLCKCPAVTQCLPCQTDLDTSDKEKISRRTVQVFQCPHHGEYRMYQSSLLSFKNTCILAITIVFIPFGLLVNAAGLDLNWVMLTGSIATIPCFPGVVLSLVWVKTSAVGLAVGSISGLVCGISANLIYASTFEGGLSQFLLNTAHPYAVLTGCCTSLFTALLLTVLVSLCTHSIASKEDEDAEWTKLRQIKNPLHPWSQAFAEEFPDLPEDTEPSYEQLSKVFRGATLTAIIGSTCSILLLVIIIPGVMASLHVLSEQQFRAWFTTLQVWCGLMAGLVLVVTPVEELRSVCGRIVANRNSRKSHETISRSPSGPMKRNVSSLYF
ncbi:uncharacterized protein LOC143298833 [Babylonia areolata]|uniref:uncharacterized protein LOC143298833 n=1 Tax=Babylonia areolata TaxID=304850 RepID=UPI003FD540DA